MPTTRGTRPGSTSVAGGSGHLHGRGAEQGGQLLGGPGHADAQGLQPGGVTHRAHHRPTLAAPGAGQHPGGTVLGHRPAAAGAAGQFATAATGQEADPTGPVQDAHHPPPGPVQLGVGGPGQPLAEQSGTRIVPRPVHDLDDGPAPALHRPFGGDQPAAPRSPPAGGTARPAAPGHRRAGPARPPRRPTTRWVPAPPGGPRRGRRAPRRPTAGAPGPRPQPGCPPPRNRPRRAAAHPSGRTATGTSADRRRSARCSARDREGATTSTPSAPPAVDQLEDEPRRVERRGQAHHRTPVGVQCLVHQGHRAPARGVGPAVRRHAGG